MTSRRRRAAVVFRFVGFQIYEKFNKKMKKFHLRVDDDIAEKES